MTLTLDAPLYFAEELPQFNIILNIASEQQLPEIRGLDNHDLKTLNLNMENVPQLADFISYNETEHKIEYSAETNKQVDLLKEQ